MSFPATGAVPSPATGTQYQITRQTPGGRAEARIAALAGGLRSYSVAGTGYVETYPDTSLPPSACGILLAPWPNRVAGGQWTLDGKVQQLDITEPSRGNASHGLLRNTGYRPAGDTAGQDSLTLQAEIFPQHGYPFHLIHQVTYSLDDDAGLRVRQSLTNVGEDRAPFALGAHPFLRIGSVPVEDLTLTVAAETRITADERLIPVGREPVAGDYDFRAGRRIGDQALDSAFTGLELAEGQHRHRLAAPDGRSVTLWSAPEFGYVHVFLTDQLPGRSRAVALEPMTAPANALNSGEGLRWLDPGNSFAAEWGIRPGLDG
ncbi:MULTISPECIES: aldose 1-epimerase family protein [Arthrobacter]|uniref:Aldose 1-epimerase family protein n=1 Tax=Arthrobacter sunyaminii TaxID=2816859 RepID=A0A975S770_9MICC|nr:MULTISPECIES: aldose 1-epimerase family protein [Arthrobacter]MBO0908066.1 aldose 1-epimerase family protein [Arthrobacter sunyaminii]QWQ37092.1 aldose 1-epimerase family protein [Arthrobacter sunyaminii]